MASSFSFTVQPSGSGSVFGGGSSRRDGGFGPGPSTSTTGTDRDSHHDHQHKSERAACLSQLVALFGRKCETDFEKYQCLEERDKLMRRMTKKVSDISKAKRNIGTSTEMCPEKERYQRIVQKRVSGFEYDAKREHFDHDAFVKDYSRSSADQEEPLSHELRPPAVLLHTMHHLLRVVDRCPNVANENALVVWFDFLWNRTRAIRKDITQQLLCDEAAVYLVECCARIHIYAGYHLCHISADTFSQKMNTENLAKCLQTLRHFYVDLRSQRTPCTNEAEFRAYDVMLNLFDTDIVLNETRALDESVLRSAPMSLAMKMFIAVHSNNYARFFRLMKGEASALQMAVLHRHLTRIRQNGLHTHISTTKSRLHTAQLTRLFAFEDDAQTVEFAVQCGMQTVGENQDMLHSDRSLVKDADTGQMGVMRNDGLMYGKMGQVPLSTLISAGEVHHLKLDHHFAEIKAIMSFDERNEYRLDPVLNSVLKESIAPGDEQMLESVRQQQQRAKNEWTRSMSSMLLDAVVRRAMELVMDQCANEAMQAQLDEDTRARAQKAAEMRQRIERNVKAKREAIKNSMQQMQEEIIENVVQTRLTEHAHSVHYHESLVQLVDRVAQSLGEEFVDNFSDWQVQKTSEQVYGTEVTTVREQLATIAQRIRTRQARMAMAPYLRRIRYRIRARHALDDMPVMPAGYLKLRTSVPQDYDCPPPMVMHPLVPPRPRPPPPDVATIVRRRHTEWIVRRAVAQWRRVAFRKLRVQIGMQPDLHRFQSESPRSPLTLEERQRHPLHCEYRLRTSPPFNFASRRHTRRDWRRLSFEPPPHHKEQQQQQQRFSPQQQQQRFSPSGLASTPRWSPPTARNRKRLPDEGTSLLHESPEFKYASKLPRYDRRRHSFESAPNYGSPRKQKPDDDSLDVDDQRRQIERSIAAIRAELAQRSAYDERCRNELFPKIRQILEEGETPSSPRNLKRPPTECTSLLHESPEFKYAPKLPRHDDRRRHSFEPPSTNSVDAAFLNGSSPSDHKNSEGDIVVDQKRRDFEESPEYQIKEISRQVEIIRAELAQRAAYAEHCRTELFPKIRSMLENDDFEKYAYPGMKL